MFDLKDFVSNENIQKWSTKIHELAKENKKRYQEMNAASKYMVTWKRTSFIQSSEEKSNSNNTTHNMDYMMLN